MLQVGYSYRKTCSDSVGLWVRWLQNLAHIPSDMSQTPFSEPKTSIPEQRIVLKMFFHPWEKKTLVCIRTRPFMISSNNCWLPKTFMAGELQTVCPIFMWHIMLWWGQGGRTEGDNMRRLGTGRPEVLQVHPGLGSLSGCYFGMVSFGESQARDSDRLVFILWLLKSVGSHNLYSWRPFTLWRCMEDTVCLHACLHLPVFTLTGPFFTDVSRGHKSLSKGKNACVLIIVLGEYKPQNTLFPPLNRYPIVLRTAAATSFMKPSCDQCLLNPHDPVWQQPTTDIKDLLIFV